MVRLGSNGALQAEPVEQGGRKVYPLKGKPEDLDGVMVLNPQGKPLATSACLSVAPTVFWWRPSVTACTWPA